jgi:hypothetical protein
MGYVASVDPDDWDYDVKGPKTREAADEAAEAAGVQIGNEFSFVRMRKVFTRNGERLEIEAPRLGTSIRLDPMQLESLTWQEPSTFSQFLESPFGPDPE